MSPKKHYIIYIIILSPIPLICLLFSNYFTDLDTTNPNIKSVNFEEAQEDISVEGAPDDFKEESVEPLKDDLKRLSIELTRKALTSSTNSSLYHTNPPSLKRIFIVTSWRSGSTFLAGTLASHPSVFYHYEPLTRFGFSDLTKEPLKARALEDLVHLSQCQYEPLEKYLSWTLEDRTILEANDKLYLACSFTSFDCRDPKLLASICSLFPVQLTKLVRLPAQILKGFLQVFKDVHFVILMRDPRAIYSSRLRAPWCDEQMCTDPKLLCSRMEDDLLTFNELGGKYPGRIHLVRYEDMAEDPWTFFRALFETLGLQWHSFVEEFLEEHITQNEDKPWSIKRIPKERVDIWRRNLSPRDLGIVQSACKSIMTPLNYTIQ